jgi:hypothetical protein
MMVLIEVSPIVIIKVSQYTTGDSKSKPPNIEDYVDFVAPKYTESDLQIVQEHKCEIKDVIFSGF